MSGPREAGAELGRHQACAKCILLGEHFVVHGAPALAVPLTTIGTQVSVRQGRPGARPRLLADLSPAEAEQAGRLLNLALKLAGCGGQGWLVEVRSDIPVGHGLGSSAAFAVALMGALARATGREPAQEQLNAQAHALERRIHGTPSGIDDTVISHRRPLWFQSREQPPELLDPPGTLDLLLASSGSPGSTREAVARVRELARQDRPRFDSLLQRARALAREGRQAFIEGDARRLGPLMSENHGLLQQLGVSTETLDRLVAAALKGGALGAKLTGGGRGGFVVALLPRGAGEQVAGALGRAGAAQVVRARI